MSASKDRTLKRWSIGSIPTAFDSNEKNPSSLTATHTVVAHEKDVNAVTISPNDRIVATASADKTIKVFI